MVGGDGSAIRQAAWEMELTSVLSKAPFSTLSVVKRCSIDFAFEDAFSTSFASGADESALPVVVEVKCDNLDFSEVSASALATTTAALKSTYNAVHSVEGDGRSLAGVQIDGPRVFSDFEAFVKAHHCTMCRRDDDAAADEKKLIEEKDLDAWQDMFVATLHKDASGTFKDVSQCAISMSAAGKPAEVF